jgi:hypothetical protein
MTWRTPTPFETSISVRYGRPTPSVPQRTSSLPADVVDDLVAVAAAVLGPGAHGLQRASLRQCDELVHECDGFSFGGRGSGRSLGESAPGNEENEDEVAGR